MYLSNTLYRYITPRTALAMHCMCSVYQQLNYFLSMLDPRFLPPIFRVLHPYFCIVSHRFGMLRPRFCIFQRPFCRLR